MKLVSDILAVVALKWALWRKKKHSIVAFDLASIGELQFFRSLLLLFAERNPDAEIIVVHHGDTEETLSTSLPTLRHRLWHIRNTVVRRVLFPEINLFLATEQYSLGLDGVYSVALFHGQPSKGLTFTPLIISSFDAFFLYGALHQDALNEFVHESLPLLPKHLDVYEIGYPKSDDLLNDQFSAKKTLTELSLDSSKKTVLYAPSFNEGASLREYGLDLIELLAQPDHYNVIVKLPIDCWKPTSNLNATGGINWFEKIHELEDKFPNLRLFSEYQIDPLLACADVLITCISSVSFEFFALNKPVVFIDTPNFFSGYLKRGFPDQDTVSWANRTTINGGKEFGLVIKNIQDIHAAIETVLAHPKDYPRQQQRLQQYLLYNRGRATETAVKTIEGLLSKRVKSRRPKTKHGLCLTLLNGLLRKFCGGVAPAAKRVVLRFLHTRGYTLQKTGCGFLDCIQTVAAAKQRGLSVCEYLENGEGDPRKRGRRDRIIAELQTTGVFQQHSRICEIGTGTGRYLEKILELVRPTIYEVYETNQEWVKFLQTEYNGRHGCKLSCHPADGHTLGYTPDDTCDLVHAHAVFIYLPLLQSLAYLKECVRVCRPGGYIAFDYCQAETFTLSVVDAWLAGPHRFPVVIPAILLDHFAQCNRLRVVRTFPMIYGNSHVEYVIWQKVAVA